MDINEYIEEHSSREDEVLQFIARDTNLHILNPHMLSGRVQGRLLSLISQMIQPRCIVELGTYTGYSALCLAEGLATNGKLITIEHNDELEDTIRHNLSLSPLGQHIDLRIGDAKQVITTLNESIDLVFMDADKREYTNYFELIYPHVRPGGWIIADNTLWDGHVIDAAYDRDAQTLGLRQFNDMIAKDDRLEKVILPLRDGLSIIRLKE